MNICRMVEAKPSLTSAGDELKNIDCYMYTVCLKHPNNEIFSCNYNNIDSYNNNNYNYYFYYMIGVYLEK